MINSDHATTREALPLDRQNSKAFPPTEWELVEAASQTRSDGGALERLLTRYLSFLEGYVVSQFSLSPDQARDWLQSFLLDKVIERDFLRTADRNRGKFRNFLLRSLHNYVIQRMRWERADKRSPSSAPLPIHELPESMIEELTATEADQFDVAWARGLLVETVRRMRSECQASGRMDLWGVFEGRLLRPLVEEVEPISYEELVPKFGFESTVQASNALITSKRVFARHLRVVIGEYAQSEQEIDNEITELKEILYRVGAELSFSLSAVA